MIYTKYILYKYFCLKEMSGIKKTLKTCFSKKFLVKQFVTLIKIIIL